MRGLAGMVGGMIVSNDRLVVERGKGGEEISLSFDILFHQNTRTVPKHRTTGHGLDLRQALVDRFDPGVNLCPVGEFCLVPKIVFDRSQPTAGITTSWKVSGLSLPVFPSLRSPFWREIWSKQR